MSRSSANDRLPDLEQAPTAQVRARMARTRRRDTSAEMAVRKEAYARGLRYRVDHQPVKGFRSRPDISFIGAQVAVYVDGCFWHGCPVHATWPKTNAEFWKAKIEANRERDARTVKCLEDAGWTALRFWECEDPVTVVDAIERVVRGR
jgi:DNA mismatch endonuclease, patch repair protein